MITDIGAKTLKICKVPLAVFSSAGVFFRSSAPVFFQGGRDGRQQIQAGELEVDSGRFMQVRPRGSMVNYGSLARMKSDGAFENVPRIVDVVERLVGTLVTQASGQGEAVTGFVASRIS